MPRGLRALPWFRPQSSSALRQRSSCVSKTPVVIHWPDGRLTEAFPGGDWLIAAREAGVVIPTGCLGGSCGACEIEVNGQVVRACMATVPGCKGGQLQVEMPGDPYW